MGAEGTMWKTTTHHFGPMSKLPADRAEALVVFSILLIFRILRFVVGVQSTPWSCDRGQHIRRYKSMKKGERETKRRGRGRRRRKGERETKIMVEREEGVERAIRKYSHLPFQGGGNRLSGRCVPLCVPFEFAEPGILVRFRYWRSSCCC